MTLFFKGEVLHSYSKSLTGEHVKPEDMISYLEKLQLQGYKNVGGTNLILLGVDLPPDDSLIRTDVSHKEKQLKELEDQIHLERQLGTGIVAQPSDLATTISVAVSVEKTGKAELTLVYCKHQHSQPIDAQFIHL